MTKRKGTAKKSRTVSPNKPKSARKKKVKRKAAKTDRDPSFAGFLDDQMIKGITWKELAKLAAPEAVRRGITSQRNVAALKAHARSRSYLDRWTVTMDDKGVKMTRRQKKGGKD